MKGSDLKRIREEEFKESQTVFGERFRKSKRTIINYEQAENVADINPDFVVNVRAHQRLLRQRKKGKD